MDLSSELLKILVCPVSNTQLIYDKDAAELISINAALAYPVHDGIPLLLVDHARKLSEDEVQKYAPNASDKPKVA